jgi:beta-lactamase class A
MTLVMDGVRRTGLIIPPLVKPVRKYASILPLTDTPNFKTMKMDGIRRSVPTPRELLATIQQADDRALPEAELVPAIRDWQQLRQAAAFSLLATTLTATGVATGVAALQTTSTVASPVVASISQIVVSNAVAAPAPPTSGEVTPTAANHASEAAAPINTGLQTLLNTFTGGSAMYGITVTNLTTGEVANVNGDTPIETASLYKLFVADEIYHRLDTGSLKLSDSAGGGSGQTIGQCLTAMITVSDNTCGLALGDIIGWGSHNAALKADGYTSTNLSGAYPVSTPNDISAIFSRLYNNTLNSPSSNTAFLDLLKGQQLNNQLPTGLPAGTVIAHKTGTIDGYIHDSGIIYGPKANYIVVMMSGPWGTPASANSEFQSLSSQLWNHFEQ